MARRPTPPGTPQPTGIGHIVDLVRHAIPPLHPAGLPFVLAPLGVAALGRNRKWVRRAGLTTAAACATFFRHPHRVPPNRIGVVVAPADGEVALVDNAVPPAELNLGSEPRPRVSIFLSVLDVHVQRSPVGGTVKEVVHQAGKFLSADLADASEVNERNSMLIETADGHDVAVVQIAGLLARRIVCYAGVGDVLPIGDTYGLIRFGSRVDTYFPAGTTLLVEPGQRTIGAETVIAQLP
ncbi:phosphatidylserine decarboxylase [Rhodococcus qingshengii]|uniref:Phosphatidylserine decarboxylase proenzyme n=6 Tax=Rhodococcus TaxID=1827 RepID=PSD_RHOE4|nr:MULTISPECIES: phosphatidylserine decarboxylase [Rhodococcus]C0ZUI0.1 RecName: Full=Phosphatidylserine decarboxylase proenzyme; Contains: RecName: Full=Phosphatidylserine decarboxylase alpha chain; Contains: RecName: Full=Phosphatidylserine decarboxylase beta chain [Rhodococcus erythropolis PR4]EEN88724.1 phosphatidylserine decarboxylase [Rhodococcus erythropolis SK121]MCD2157659.1 phosphatidylserine decarboxylase [Rhodococcus cerastii]NHE67149.1 phosphatidylserine decarboxylase [Rhodococcus 